MATPRGPGCSPNACTLLIESELEQLGALPQGELIADTDARFCGWQAPGLRLGVALGSGTLEEVETSLDIGTGDAATGRGPRGTPDLCARDLQVHHRTGARRRARAHRRAT